MVEDGTKFQHFLLPNQSSFFFSYPLIFILYVESSGRKRSKKIRYVLCIDIWTACSFFVVIFTRVIYILTHV